MVTRISALSLACAFLALMRAETTLAAGDCPNEAIAAREAARAYKLRRGEFLPEAAAAFESAYRCMPVDRGHEERWEHLASYLETVQRLPREDPSAALARSCHARELIDEYQRSLRSVSPAPDAAEYAAAERRRIEEELASLSPGVDPCPKTAEKPPDPGPAASSTGSTDIPAPAVQATPSARDDRGTSRSSWRAVRPLVAAGAAMGAAGVASFVVMGVGLGIGDRAEGEAAAAMKAGQLQQIREDIHPDGVLGNRMAYGGAIVGGALLVTGVVLLTVAARRARASQARVSGGAAGLVLRF